MPRMPCRSCRPPPHNTMCTHINGDNISADAGHQHLQQMESIWVDNSVAMDGMWMPRMPCRSSFCCSVRLRMICCGHLQLCSGELGEPRPEFTREEGFSVANYGFRHIMDLIVLVEECFSNVGCLVSNPPRY